MLKKKKYNKIKINKRQKKKFIKISKKYRFASDLYAKTLRDANVVMLSTNGGPTGYSQYSGLPERD